MKKNVSIKKLMKTELKTITLQTKLSDVRVAFKEASFHHLPVVEGTKILGMVSINDFLEIDSSALFHQDPKEADAILDSISSVKEVMTGNLKTLDSEATIRDATEVLGENNFHALPIVENGDTLVGMVTTTDLLRFYNQNY